MSNYILDQYGRHFERKGGSHHNTLSNWVTSVVRRITTENQNRLISDRSWDLYLNGAYGRGILEGIVIDTAGTGITPVFDPIKDITGEIDIDLMTSIWDVTANDPRKFFDFHMRQSLAKLQALAIFQWKMDGIGVFQVIYGANTFSPSKISLKPIDSYYVKTPSFKQNENIYDGIEVNDDGQPVAIYIYKTENDWKRLPLHDKDTGLPLFLLVNDVRNIYEYKQDGILGNIIKEIKDSDEATDAVLVKFLISNLFTAFIKDSNFFDTYDGDPDDGSMIDRTVEMEKGTMIFGAQGEEPVILGSSDQPGPEYEQMHNSILERIGVSTVRGSQILKRDFDSSFSAARAAMENSMRVDSYDISILNDNFNQPLASWFVYDLIVRGIIKTQESIEDIKRSIYAYSRASWITQPRIDIDQLKSAKTDTERLNNGTKTYSEIWAQRGKRPKEELQRIVNEVKLIEEIEEREGVDLSFMKRGEKNDSQLFDQSSIGDVAD